MPESALRVLLVEDNPTDAQLMHHALRQAGFNPEMTRVDTESEYLAGLDSAPDIILCDYNLPQFDAMRALDLLREAHPEIPLLIVSGSIGEEAAVEFMKRGAFDYLLKDQLGRLGPAVRQALVQRRSREAERQALEALRASEEQHRSLAESIPQIVWTALPDGEIDYLNRRGLEYTDLKGEDLLGWGWDRIVHPDDLPHTLAVWGESLRTGEPREFEFRIRRADGEYRWHLVRQVAVRDHSGAVSRWFGTCTDIQDQVAASERLARDAKLLASVQDAIIVIDASGIVTYWNAGASRLFKWPTSEMLGRRYVERFPEPVRTEMAEFIQSVWAGCDWSGEYEDYRKDGSRVWVEARVTRITDAAGQAIGIMGVSHDISHRKQAEAERDQVLGRLRFQIERIPLAYVLTDAEFRIIDWNVAAERIFGFSKAEMLGEGPPFSKISPPANWPQAKKRLHRIQSGDMAAHSINPNLTKDGRVIICEWHNTPLMDGNDAFTGMISLTQDITSRIESEETLRLRDRAIQATSQGILITDPNLPDNPIIYVSPGFERLTGYAAAEVLGRNCRLLQGTNTDPDAVAAIREAVAVGRECAVELLNYRKDGTPFWNALAISPVREGTRITHFIGVQTNVTERRQLEERFQQAQKMEAVGRLAGGIAHDFNNLLSVILGYSGLLLQTLPEGASQREALTAIHGAGERATGLTRQLLAFSRKTIVAPKVVDLNELVDHTGTMLRRLIGEDITLTTVLSPRLNRIKADPGQVEQVLMNLAVNARDAMPTGGRLTIETANTEVEAPGSLLYPGCPPGRYVRTSVSDSGSGMSEETQQQIFEPFFTTKEVGQGTGLGLATVFGIVKQAEGFVFVESAVGEGTTFCLLFPAVRESALAKTSAPERAAPRGSETVLLVEDEEAVRRLARLCLEMQGYTVLEAISGKAALEAAAAHSGPIHLLLTDVVMPKMGGRELADALRALRPEAKVLYMSGYTDDAMLRYGVSHSRDAFLQKPFTLGSITAKVRAVLDQESGIDGGGEAVRSEG